MPHLLVAFSYAALQLLINLHVISNPVSPLSFLTILSSLALVWALLKFRIFQNETDRSRPANP
jgi:hypothetical protein